MKQVSIRKDLLHEILNDWIIRENIEGSVQAVFIDSKNEELVVSIKEANDGAVA